MTRGTPQILGAAAFALLACKGHHANPALDMPLAPLAHARLDDGGAPGANKIAGSAGGTTFTAVEAAFVIESPESEATTVIYLLSKPVRCVDLSFSEWDRAIPDGTMVLELKIFGKAPGAFLTVTTTPHSPRESTAEWMRTSPKGAEKVIPSDGGWITIDSLSPHGPATGTFALDFGASQLTGTFEAAFCAGGHEP
jgi:hypothetical protein